MHTTKFTTIISLLVLGAMANGPKPASSHSQLPVSANAEFKSDLEEAPSGATLHSSSKAPKSIKLPSKLVKAASTKGRSGEAEHNEHVGHDTKFRSIEPSMSDEKSEGFADTVSKPENENSKKEKSEEETALPSLARLLSSDSLPSQALINKARDEIQMRIKDNQADIKREIAALMVVAQEQNIVDQINKIKIVAPLELSDIFIAGQNGFGSQFPMGAPIFPIPGMPGPVISAVPELNEKPLEKPLEKPEEDEHVSSKLHASSIRQPTAIPPRGLERFEDDNSVVLIEQDSEVDSAMPPSTPASDAQSTPGKLVDTQPASDTPLPASTGPQSQPAPESPPPATPGPQAAPNAPAPPPQANQQPQPQSQPQPSQPQEQPQSQPQGQQSPILQSQQPAPSDPKDSVVNTEGTAME